MKLAQTGCSQCGATFGPGDEGFSHCDMHAPVTKVQREASGWSADSDIRALTPMVERDPVPGWWRAVEAHLDEEPLYEFGEVSNGY